MDSKRMPVVGETWKCNDGTGSLVKAINGSEIVFRQVGSGGVGIDGSEYFFTRSEFLGCHTPPADPWTTGPLQETKRHWLLVPWDAMGVVVDCLSYGPAKGHPEWGWQRKPARYHAEAAQRHLVAILTGELKDRESGLPHAAHLASRALFMLWHHMKEAT